jgi:hypothetical protein
MIFKLTELIVVSKLKEYYIPYSEFYIDENIKIQFVVSSREDMDDIHFFKKRILNGNWVLLGAGKYKHLKQSKEIGIGVLPNLNMSATRLILREGHLIIRDNRARSPKYKIYTKEEISQDKHIYTFNGFEMGLFKAARERAQKKLKMLEEK